MNVIPNVSHKFDMVGSVAYRADMSVESLLAKYRADAVRLQNEARAHERLMRKADNDHLIVDAKIAGILEAIEAIKASPAEDEHSNESPAIEKPKPRFFRTADGRLVTIRRRQRKLSDEWQQIMQYTDSPHGFGYDELVEAAKAIGHVVSKDNLRSQMSLYKAAGLIDAIDAGKFRITDAGRRAAGIATETEDESSSNENEPPNGKPEGGSEAPDGKSG